MSTDMDDSNGEVAFSCTSSEYVSCPDQPFELRNDGGGSMRWQASADVAWFTVSPNSGIVGEFDKAVISPQFVINDIQAGTYTGTLTILSNESGPQCADPIDGGMTNQGFTCRHRFGLRLVRRSDSGLLLIPNAMDASIQYGVPVAQSSRVNVLTYEDTLGMRVKLGLKESSPLAPCLRRGCSHPPTLDQREV